MVNETKQHITRKLRRQQTPWETKIWNVLRNRQVNNMKFRRQFKISDYVVDFCCLDKKLIVELDGGHHNEEANVVLDKFRQHRIEALGFKVLRFWNNEVDENLQGIIDRIMQYSQPHPSLSRLGEGKNA